MNNRQTKTSICNKALDLIGEDNINSMEDESSLTGRVCRRHFDDALQSVLEEGMWPIATVEEPLAKISTKEYSEEQKYVYAIPANCALIIRIFRKEQRKEAKQFHNDWDIRFIPSKSNTYIISDIEEDAYIEYVRISDSMHIFPTSFIDCLVADLASRICTPLKKDLQSAIQMKQYAEALKSKAKMKAYNEDGQQKLNWVDPITSSRSK